LPYPRPVSWWIYIHYVHIPKLYHYGKKLNIFHPSNQGSLYLGFVKILYCEGD
jgi:hypothetical protein